MVKWDTIIGKTIEHVDEEFGSNVILIRFSDQSEIVIDTDNTGWGFFVPVLQYKEAYDENTSPVCL